MRIYWPDSMATGTARYDPGLRLYVPEGFDLQQNAAWAQQNIVTAEDMRRAASALTQGISIKDSGAPWFRIVGTGGEWDYKRQSPLFEDLGNYNAGYTAYHAGLSQLQIEIGGGLYQIKSGTSKTEWVFTFFDDPRDNEMIARGWRDAEAAAEAEMVNKIERLLMSDTPVRLPVPLRDNGVLAVPYRPEQPSISRP